MKLSLSESVSVTHLLVSASSEHCRAVAETHVTFLTDKDKDKDKNEDKDGDEDEDRHRDKDKSAHQPIY